MGPRRPSSTPPPRRIRRGRADGLEEFDPRAGREAISDDLTALVYAWLLSRRDDPYQAVRRADGFDNLWCGRVPSTHDPVTRRVVTCSYRIEEQAGVVQLDIFGLPTVPL